MISKALAVVLFLLSSTTVTAGPAEPQPGMWWSPSESGRGYSLDPQGDLMVVTTFGYDDSGRMQWYYSPGNLSAGGYHWSGPMLKFDFGQPLNGGFIAPTLMGNDGTLTMDFTSRVTGTVTFPNGRRVAIQRQNFGVGDPPQALLGQWAYVYLIGSAPFVDVYKFTTLGSATSTGTGVAIDLLDNAGFEYETSGTFAGQVIGFHFNSAGTVLDTYLFQLQMEEGRGVWIAPATFNQYGMSAYKTNTPSGLAKRTIVGDSNTDLAMKAVMSTPQGERIADLEARDPARGALARQMWAQISSLK
jgi:hypothetical protein